MGLVKKIKKASTGGRTGAGTANRSQSKTHKQWQLNPGKVIHDLKKNTFKQLPETKDAFRSTDSETANYANMGLVLKLNTKRNITNYKIKQAIKERHDPNYEKPKPVDIQVPDEEKSTLPPIIAERAWDYVIPLYEAHGNNIKAMWRDQKRNYLFKSERELTKLTKRYLECKEFGESKVAYYVEAEKKLLDSYEKRPNPKTILGAPKKEAKRDDVKTDDIKTDDVKPTTTTQPTTTTATTKTTTSNNKRKLDTITKPDTPTAKSGKVAKTETKKPAPAPAPKPAITKTSKAPAKPASKPDDDESDLEGLEFDFDENDLSSDDDE